MIKIHERCGRPMKHCERADVAKGKWYCGECQKEWTKKRRLRYKAMPKGWTPDTPAKWAKKLENDPALYERVRAEVRRLGLKEEVPEPRVWDLDPAERYERRVMRILGRPPTPMSAWAV